MNPTQDNAPGAPMIPAGTTSQGGMAYDPLKAAVAAATHGQAPQAPASTVPQPTQNANIQAQAPVQSPSAPTGTTFADLATKKGWTSPDDMAKSYAELESHNKRVEMTAADVIKLVNEGKTVPNSAPLPAPVATTPDTQAIEIVRAIAQDTVRPLQQQVELQQLFLNNPDAKDYAAGIAEAVKTNPGISWNAAYKVAKFDALEQKAKETVVNNQQQTNVLRQSVQVGSGTPTANRGGPDVRSIISDRSVPFSEVTKMVTEYLGRVNQ